MNSERPPNGCGPIWNSPQPWGRRALLGAGGVAGLSALVGCGSSSPAADASTTPTIRPSAPAGIPWKQLRVSGRLTQPSDAGYAAAKLTENPRFDLARPLAVLRAANPSDIQAAIRFARDHEVPLAIRSGGHSYAGLSAGGTPAALVLDLRSLSGVTVNGGSATLGAGVSLAVAYAQLAAASRAIPAGSCPTVGLSGLTLGGGVGVLTRAFGLTSDNVTSVSLVNADGDLVTANATENPDLFWALRGGGGRLGVATSFTMKTYAAPTVHTFYRRWAPSAAAEVVPAWQNWITSADARLWSTLKLLGGDTHTGGPSLMVSGTWIGSASSNPLVAFLAQCPPALGSADSTLTYGQAMASYAGCSTIPVAQCHTGPGGALTREALAATSHIAKSTLPSAGIAAMVEAVSNTPRGLKEAGISIDSLGGVVNDIGADETAWAHRGALATVQYTATVTDVSRIQSAQTWVRSLRARMVPWWGDAAYVNYIDSEVGSGSYFGAHLARLRSIKKDMDPSGVFGAGW